MKKDKDNDYSCLVMYYKYVEKLPKDCLMCEQFPYPFKFGRYLYVYEPSFDCFGEACFYRRKHSLNTPIARYLSCVDNYSVRL